MCIYCGTNNYRKIYENHHGPIPREEDGRTYEIHHKDGDHSNNDPTNLMTVTIQEHYDIHYQQGDFGACFLIATQRMNKTPNELSELGRLKALKQVDDGTHHFIGGDIQRKLAQSRLENGTHHFLGENNPSVIRVENGTHHLLGGVVVRAQLESGKHPSQVKWQCPHCLKEGRHMGPYKQFHGDKCKEKK